MKTITKELNLLDIEDIEKAVSKSMNREVKIGEIECILNYCIPCSTNIPDGMILDLYVVNKPDDFEVLYSFDLFGNEPDCPDMSLNGKRLSLNEPWLPVEEIFSFDVSAFKSFDIGTDSSD